MSSLISAPSGCSTIHTPPRIADTSSNNPLPARTAAMVRKTDRLYVTHTEHSGIHGQHTAGGSGKSLHKNNPDSAYQPIPFTSCAISLQPWSNPVCDREDGTIYELTNVIPWIKKHGVSPSSGKLLKAADLLTLHFHKNESTGTWHDPVSFKAFNDSTHLVAIGTSGNVYAYDTIQQLNIKAKFWSDLLTGEEFTRKDLITLQDPNNPSGKNVANLHHLKEGLTLSAADKGQAENQDEVNVAATGSASSLIRSLKKKKADEQSQKDSAGEAALRKMEQAASNSQGQKKSEEAKNVGIASTGRTAASFTSTGLTPQTKQEREVLNEEDVMYDDIKRGGTSNKGYVRLTTNFGPLNLELHCDKAPKTCYNFLTLCRRGYYTDTIFHRNIPGFMIQGGDPSGSGRGGESMWGKTFADELNVTGAHKHTARGVLSMANRGPDTNGSQFFITYAAKPHLDKKHTVFGQLVDSPSQTLDALEKIPTEAGTDKPLRAIRILDVQIYNDPFEIYQEKLNKKLHRNDHDEILKREEKRKKRESDRTTWFGTNLGAKGDNPDPDAVKDDPLAGLLPPSASSSTKIGRYLSTESGKQSSKPKRDDPADIGGGIPAAKKRKQVGGGKFGDFAGW